MSHLYRQLPKVDVLVADERLRDAPRALAVRTARSVLDELRWGIREGTLDAVPDVPALVQQRLALLRTPDLRHVVNATGVVIHTNLGRAPLHPAAADAVQAVARGYSNLELDLATGKRGGRLAGVREPLCRLVGSEDAIAVNNNAAAVLLVLSALCEGREAIVSRGELVEIGGSFRMPDVMAASGCRMVEVGSTNRTRASDYGEAITPDTGLLVRCHPSNYRVVGFTARPSTRELAELGVPLYEDLGSGALAAGVPGEPPVAEVLADGAAIVSFSGDKLLGGPQAGLIAGRAELVQRCRRHPLYRALRLDKLVLAALEATLRVHERGEAVPVLAMLDATTAAPAEALAERLSAADLGLEVSVEEDVGYSGGGALPGQPLPGHVVALRGPELDELARLLRTGTPAVVGRIARDALLLDPRTLRPGEDLLVERALRVARSAQTGQ